MIREFEKNFRYPALFFLILLTSSLAQPVSGLVIFEYFHQQGCINCEQTNPIIDTIRTQYRGRVTVEDVEIDNQAGVRLLLSYGVTEIPVVVVNRNKVLEFRNITPERLDAEIRLAESGAYPVPGNKKSLFDGDNSTSLVLAFILGLMTGLSPCLLGSLVIVIAAAPVSSVNGQPGKYYPLAFGAGIIIAYLLAAAVILGVGIAFQPAPSDHLVVYGSAGIIAIVVGALQLGLFSLPGRINRHSSGMVSRFRSLNGAFLLGLFFAVLFAPCAIAPFLVLIEAILISNSVAPVAMMVGFSAGLYMPYLIFCMLRNSVLEKRLLQYAGIVQKIGGLLLIIFGIWLVLLA